MMKQALGYLLGASLSAVAVSAELCPISLESHALPDPLRSAVDVRIMGKNVVAMATLQTGAYRYGIEDGDLERLVAKGNSGDQTAIPYMVGVGEGVVFVGSRLFQITWTPSHGRGIPRSNYFEAMVDLDASGREVLVFGLTKDESGRYGAENASAWRGEVDPALESLTLRPVLFVDEGGIDRINDCGLLDVSVARFLPNGNALIVPGLEQGVLELDPNGLLVRSWQAEMVGIDNHCPPDETVRRRISADAAMRQKLRNERRMVDEILPLHGGPALLIRARYGGETRWRLVQLEPGGIKHSCELPFTAKHDGVHLRGDVQGDLWVLVSSVLNGSSSPKVDPPMRSELLIAHGGIWP